MQPSEALNEERREPQCDAFPSYSHKGTESYKSFIQDCVADLKRLGSVPEGEPGFRCYYDMQTLSGTRYWQDSIEPAIKNAFIYIIFVTKAYFDLESTTVRELKLMTAEEEKNRLGANKKFIVPILCEEGCEVFIKPWDLPDNQWCDLRSTLTVEKRQEAWSKVLRDLKAIASERLSTSRRAADVTDDTAEPEDPQSLPLLAYSQVLHVIGWKGIEDQKIYDGSPDLKIRCLVIERSFDTPPSLEFDGNRFNVIVADRELLPRYGSLHKIQNLLGQKDRYEKEIGRILMLIRDRIWDNVPGFYYGLPIQFGFNEILVNMDGLKKTSPIRERLLASDEASFAYTDFSLEDLLNSGELKRPIGLWNWYLPTLCQLLLCDRKYRAACTNLDAYCDCVSKGQRDVSAVTRLTKLIKKNGKSIRFFDNLDRARDDLSDGNISVLYGGTSALLAGPNTTPRQGPVRVIIPQEGLLMWVNCSAALTEQHSDLWRLLKYWLRPDIQVRLWTYNESYKGLPVMKDGIRELLATDPLHPSLLTLTKVMPEQDVKWCRELAIPRNHENKRFFDAISGRAAEPLPTSFRPFPTEHWWTWAQCWEEMQKTT